MLNRIQYLQNFNSLRVGQKVANLHPRYENQPIACSVQGLRGLEHGHVRLEIQEEMAAEQLAPLCVFTLVTLV